MDYSKKHQYKDQTYYSHSRVELLPFIPPTITQVLDIGCGIGNFGNLLKERFNCKVWGIEPDKNSALTASKKLDCVLNCRWDKNIDLKGKKFDCIFLNDVLEHLVDPYYALEICKIHLSSKGYVISSIPNILHFDTLWKILITQDWKYEDAGILDRTHLRFFTKKSIFRMFEDSGLKVINIQGINSCYGRKFTILNAIFLNKLKEMQYIQYVTVAQI